MTGVSCSPILVGRVTLHADPVAGSAKLRTVRLVAITANDASPERLALFERAIVINLIEHLPVRMKEPLHERLDDMCVGKPPARNPVLGKFAAPCMAQATGLGLLTK